MKKIERITILEIVDTDPDTSWMGEYGNVAKTEYAIRTNRSGPGYYQWFNPPVENYAGEPKKDIRKYCRQDFERFEALNDGKWHFIGMRATADVTTSWNGKEWLHNNIRSGGLWGIESDSDQSYKDEVAQDQLAELKLTLMELGFTKEEIGEAKLINKVEA